MNEQILRIRRKLKELKSLDKSFKIFGSEKHKYQLNTTLSSGDVKSFEDKYKIQLPEEFKEFLINIGNGGAGPFYGVEPFQDMVYSDLDYKSETQLLDPSKPFPHTEKWNLKFEPSVTEEEDEAEYQRQYESFGEKYYHSSHMNGVLAICNFGCAVSINLVVNGPEHGYIWTDDRTSEAGIYPSMELGNKEKIKFLDWYELWLDESLEKIGSTQKNITIRKPWWKFW